MFELLAEWHQIRLGRLSQVCHLAKQECGNSMWARRKARSLDSESSVLSPCVQDGAHRARRGSAFPARLSSLGR